MSAALVVEPHLARWRREYEAETVLQVSSVSDVVEPVDLLIVRSTLADVPDWRAHVASLAALARKALVLIVPNAQSVAEVAGRLLHGERREDPGSTATLAPVLWELGRVREHTYLGVPPALARAPTSVIVRVAPSHVFVVDVRPRTRQARRRLLRTA